MSKHHERSQQSFMLHNPFVVFDSNGIIKVRDNKTEFLISSLSDLYSKLRPRFGAGRMSDAAQKIKFNGTYKLYLDEKSNEPVKMTRLVRRTKNAVSQH